MPTIIENMTERDLLNMPNDGKRRWLIGNKIKVWDDLEFPEHGMTVRNRFHSQVMMCIACELMNWLRNQPKPHGVIVGGEAGFKIPVDTPDTASDLMPSTTVTVGVDVAYVSHDVMKHQTDKTRLIEGVPTLVVEILSPSDTVEIIDETVDTYTKAGVPMFWLVNPHDHTVKIHTRGEEPYLVNIKQELSGEPYLPGFRVPVSRLFE